MLLIVTEPFRLIIIKKKVLKTHLKYTTPTRDQYCWRFFTILSSF